MAYNIELAYYQSPIGTIQIEGAENGLASLYFVDDEVQKDEVPFVLSESYRQVDEYFKRKRTHFDLKLLPEGTAFQLKVWKELQNLSFGKRMSYLDLSKKLGDPKAIRAVANANSKNPISIIIPCHRVIGSDGSLTGYGGGLWRKKWLLDFESGNQRLFSDPN